MPRIPDIIRLRTSTVTTSTMSYGCWPLRPGDPCLARSTISRSFLRQCSLDMRPHCSRDKLDNRNDHGISELLVSLRVGYRNPELALPVLESHESRALGRG